eukprot:5125101-Prymnesium_polylepis.2
MEASYPTWWPGQGVAFASDNWQTDRSWGRARLGQSNVRRAVSIQGPRGCDAALPALSMPCRCSP